MKILFGKVLSCNMNKTVVILVKKFNNIKFYKKLIFNFMKLHAHDSFNFCKKDDFVYILQVKPYSKKKFWKVIYIF